MVPSYQKSADPKRTLSASFIVGSEPDIWPHPFINPGSMFVFAPPRRKLRARRTPVRRKRARANAYAATLAVDTYLEEARQALRDSDDAEALNCLEVIRGIVEVALGQLRGSVTLQ